jgi:hypothetical protein
MPFFSPIIKLPALTGLPLNELEKQAITDTLAKTKGNREKAVK